jgi:hypothetical protein
MLSNKGESDMKNNWIEYKGQVCADVEYTDGSSARYTNRQLGEVLSGVNVARFRLLTLISMREALEQMHMSGQCDASIDPSASSASAAVDEFLSHYAIDESDYHHTEDR